MKDLIIGAITNYKYEQIEPWVNSIENSGFTGRKALIVYNIDAATSKRLIDKGFSLFGFEQNDKGDFTYPGNTTFNIMVERFIHAWYFLSELNEEIDNIIWTDVKDVIFQKNPSEYLESMPEDKKIVVGCENFRYKDEPWNNNNMLMSFGPLIHHRMLDKKVYCAGVIAGKKDYVLDLFRNIFMMCRGSQAEIPGGGGPDQAALNICLTLKPYADITDFSNTEDSWVAHLGTSMPAILSGSGGIGEQYVRDPSSLNTFKSAMLNNDPVMVGNLVCNQLGEAFHIVHQYDRVTKWKPILEKKYRS